MELTVCPSPRNRSALESDPLARLAEVADIDNEWLAAALHRAVELLRRYYMPENGIDPQKFPLAAGWPEPKGAFTFATVGRLVPYKGFDLVIEAMARSARLRSVRLVIVGDGPERANLQRAATGLTGIEFAGWLDQIELGCVLASAQVFAFPSLREFGGAVVLEAMALGAVPIVVDYGGPGELVGDAGVRLPLRPRAELVADLRAAMERLADSPDTCRALGREAVERVRTEFTWAAKAERLVEMYRDLTTS